MLLGNVIKKYIKKIAGSGNGGRDRICKRQKTRADRLRRIVAVTAATAILAMIFSLSSCAVSFDEETTPEEEARTVQLADRPQGSAAFLDGDVLLVSIYVSDETSYWSDTEKAYSDKALDMACEWIEDQGAGNGYDLDLICEGDDLHYEFQKKGLLEASKADDSNSEFDDFYNDLENFIKRNIPADELKMKYKAKSVGFIAFLAGEGNSYALPYSPSLGDDLRYYNEISFLYCYDESSPDEYENPSTYAHEILHLFGAADLYEENSSDGISDELVEEIEEYYPDELMYYTYEYDDTSDFDSINKELSPYSLYFIGWRDGEDLFDKYPEIEREYKCAF